MAMQDLVIGLIEELLKDGELALTEEDIRFYDRGTTAETDEGMDDHTRWRNARYYNADSNVLRSSILVVRISVGDREEYINFHMGDLYRLYRKDGMDGVLPIVKKDIGDLKASASQTISLIDRARDYEAIKEHLIIRPLNYDDNAKVLDKAIYREVGDMALVLYISLGSIDQSIASAMVPYDVFQSWGLDETEVIDRALENTMRLQPPVIYRYISETKKQEYIPFMADESVSFDFDSPTTPSLALTTRQGTNGAVAAFYPGVLERLYRMGDRDLYLCFTGISDVHIYLVNGRFSVSAIRRSLDRMNRNMNGPGELLSRKIYRYDGEQHAIVLV